MKKDRNAFFQNQSSSSYFYPTSPMPNMTNMNMGYPMATESSSNFYQGPVIAPANGMPSNDYGYSNELESRLAKIERTLNRLDTRISKLESELTTNIGSNEYTANNMYMV